MRCDGLILCLSCFASNYFVCNPITRQWVTISIPANIDLFSLEELLDEGLAAQTEEGILTGYKIVLIKANCEITDIIDLTIFSSETGQWTSHKVHSPNLCNFWTVALLLP